MTVVHKRDSTEPLPGATQIGYERARQQMAEGYDAEHDDEHVNEELADAAACYIIFAPEPGKTPYAWPWNDEDWKPSGDRIRDLVKAGALIAAEIDRLIRMGVHKDA